MAGGGQGSGGMGGGQVAGGMGGMGGGMGLLPGEPRPDRNPGGGMGGPVSGTMGGAGGDLGTASYMNKGGFDGGYGGGMGGFGGGYGMGSPFGGYGGGMGGFGMGMGSPFGGFGGMPMYGGYGGGMGGYGGGMGGYGGGMGGYGGFGGMGGFSRGMGSPFRGGMGGIQDRMYRGEPGMVYAGGSPGFYSNPQTRSDTGFDFHPVDFEQHVMGGIQDRMYRGQPGRDMPVQEGGRSSLTLPRPGEGGQYGGINPGGGFKGSAPLSQQPTMYRPMYRPVLMPAPETATSDVITPLRAGGIAALLKHK